ncbi:M20/M25/M40 family metallo-hydrolase [Bradyrhizobium sp. AZCC 2230]|uniref:M20/M25/M40 family metallo-hydrolase n=1 Tax=Bradyrhizobium sp. AZCC 2230 TaxID=3117021 RepID=UPI002FF18414
MDEAAAIVAARHGDFPEASIGIQRLNDYPGLATPADSAVVDFLRGLLDEAPLRKVAFGTEGGLFADRLGIPTVVCGPGSMEQGHKADEFIAVDQLAACDRLMERLLDSIAA